MQEIKNRSVSGLKIEESHYDKFHHKNREFRPFPGNLKYVSFKLYMMTADKMVKQCTSWDKSIRWSMGRNQWNLENTLNSEVDRQTDKQKALKYSMV